MNLQTLQPGEMVQLMQGRPMRLVTVAINLLIVVWIAWMLANLTLELMETGEPVDQPVTVEAPPAPQEDQYRMLVGQMSSWKLMGEAKVKTAEPARPAAPVVAPETRLKLTLRGSLDSDDTDLARAIIADQRGDEELYSIGDEVPGNAELSEIHIDRVILLRGGRYETLSLPDDTRGSGSGGRTSPAGSATSQSQHLKNIRKTLKNNPKSLFSLVRANPKRDEEGKMIGYILKPGGRNPKMFTEMGLQSGDLVTRINDIELTDTSSGMRALKSVQSGDSVTLTVLRGGQEQQLSFSMPQ
jgi:general secretion pathway protein C